jgi:hypothetical protein
MRLVEHYAKAISTAIVTGNPKMLSRACPDAVISICLTPRLANTDPPLRALRELPGLLVMPPPHPEPDSIYSAVARRVVRELPNDVKRSSASDDILQKALNVTFPTTSKAYLDLAELLIGFRHFDFANHREPILKATRQIMDWFMLVAPEHPSWRDLVNRMSSFFCVFFLIPRSCRRRGSGVGLYTKDGSTAIRPDVELVVSLVIREPGRDLLRQTLVG